MRRRVQDLAREVEEREAVVTEALFSATCLRCAAALHDLRARATTPATTETELPRSPEVTLRAYRDALNRAIELAPDLEDEQRALPEDAPNPQLAPHLRPYINLFMHNRPRNV